MNKKILVVGGSFDNYGGRKSSLVEKITNEILKINTDTIVYNGGCFKALKEMILPSVVKYDIVFWWANVPNTEEKVRNVKEINPRVILISSKRNDNEKYLFSELINRALGQKSNLVVEFSKIEDKKFNMRVFDPLGTVWYNGTDIQSMVKNLMCRAEQLTKFTRVPSVADIVNAFPEVPNEEKFFAFARNCSDIFHNLINPDKNVTRFLGNMSFRCQNGFPSFRGENGLIFVSKRNIDKREINKDSFVPCYLDENNTVKYFGENKPSVDTPIQLRLYKLHPEINYMIHAHCYFDYKQVLTTDYPVPCGALEEVDEIENAIKNSEYNGNGFIAVNLKGHGCILMTNRVERLLGLMKFKDSFFVSRPMPESIQP